MGSAPRKARTRSLHDPAYAAFVEELVALRDRSGMKQWQIAAALGWNQSVVSKIETQQRRIDVVELIRVLDFLGEDPVEFVRLTQRLLASSDDS
jgi:transcriptional regulator with XRE-family HTH domain